jgi:hypothetical protein
LALLAACGPDLSSPTGPLAHGTSASGRYALDVYTTPQPPVRGQITGRLVITDQGELARGMTPKITPWMPEHAHGTSVTPSVTEAENGDYLVNDLYLPMEGLWQLRTAVDDSKDDEIDVTFEVR